MGICSSSLPGIVSVAIIGGIIFWIIVLIVIIAIIRAVIKGNSKRNRELDERAKLEKALYEKLINEEEE